MAEHTKDKRGDKRDFREEARLAVNPGVRQEAQAEALAEQLEQQHAARGDVPDGEQSSRAAHSAEGGGAWPQERLGRFLSPPGPVVAYAPEQHYTSHESDKK